jgi:hypothetical protein
VFLPESSVTRELRQKQLARADGGQGEWHVEMEIRLYREKPSAGRPGKPLVGRLWDYLVKLHANTEKSPGRNSVVKKIPS